MKLNNIKIKNLSTLLLFTAIAFIITSCNKQDLIPTDTDGNTSAINEKNHSAPNDHCLVTHTEDDLFGNLLDIFYNNSGNPDSMSFGGNFPITMDYDNNDRLLSATYGTQGTRYDFFYNGNSFLPAFLNFYYQGVHYADISFTHNNKGKIIKLEISNLTNGNSVKEIFTYNSQGNVTKATLKLYDPNGILTSSYIENEASTYDHKKNFMGGNQWLKYILYNSGISIADYFRMFSRNNPIDYTWGYNGGFNPIHATYNYNNQGFANTINFNLLDTDYVTVLASFTQLSLSTCDNNCHKQVQPVSSKGFTLAENKFLRVLPSTIN